MSKRDELVEKYAKDLTEKCGVAKPDLDLLKKVVIGLGPSVYNKDSSVVAASDKKELERIKENFLIKKLGLKDSPKLDEGIQAAIDTYGRANRTKYRAVLYYLMVKSFRKTKVYD
jgi:hypothetical protein